MELAKAMLPDGVSIPSRRVGDQYPPEIERYFIRVSIPSRRVGDCLFQNLPVRHFLVSIPSRRVGDQGEMRGKAGKRRQKGGRVAVDLR